MFTEYKNLEEITLARHANLLSNHDNFSAIIVFDENDDISQHNEPGILSYRVKKLIKYGVKSL